jgi:hypothetical protein
MVNLRSPTLIEFMMGESMVKINEARLEMRVSEREKEEVGSGLIKCLKIGMATRVTSIMIDMGRWVNAVTTPM